MANASISTGIAAPTEPVWSIVGGFDNLPLWLKVVASSTLEDGGRVRRLVTGDASVIVERLLSFEEAAKRFTYTHVTAPDQVTDYVATMIVNDVAVGKSRVTWSSSFTGAGWSAAEAVAHFEAIYSRGLADLKSLLERD
ncbi:MULTISPECIES: SRPBCC family protein [unclassified Bradyrhizobium]|uniref:SRPBCC family protein n=1 Tax=unclassified Bradyrhizobium TaxID=2631580 RepID=UPI002FF09F26